MGRKRNKEETIRKLIDAVGRILAEKGHAGLGVNKVALEAGVSKPLIYNYFGGLNNLLRLYVREKDYWLPYFEKMELPEGAGNEELKNLFIQILQDQLRYFHDNREMQKLILWQISKYDALMRNISETREKAAMRLLGLTDDYFRGSGISLKAVIAFLVGGIYFIVLHNAAGSGSVSGIDLGNEKDFDQLLSTIAKVIELVWQAAAEKK